MNSKSGYTSHVKKIAIFDFDGTLTKTDSFNIFFLHKMGYISFLIFSFRNAALILRSLFDKEYVLHVKECFLGEVYKNVPYSEFLHDAEIFGRTKIDNIINPRALKKLHIHQESGHEIAIITASPTEWVKTWAEMNHISSVFGSKIEVNDGKLTGRLATHMYGEKKVECIKHHFKNAQDIFMYAYGDSAGDLPMLQFVDEGYYKNFDKAL